LPDVYEYDGGGELIWWMIKLILKWKEL
jgi:hypothetical protein